MTPKLDYEWRLRLLLAEKGVWHTAELRALLAERGIRLSESQVWRLMTGRPERLNLSVLMACCDILDCTPNDLIVPIEAATAARLEKRAAAASGLSEIVPKKARIRIEPRERH